MNGINNNQLNIDIPEKLMFLINEQWRYKVCFGGRAGYKSWSAVHALLILSMKKEMRILCCREILKSIKGSIHQLLSDRIRALGLTNEFEILNNEIRNKVNGGFFSFDGLRDSTIDVKSKEGYDICLIEEAEDLTENSFNDLYPTLRKKKSEIWLLFNTPHEDAFVYQYFVINTPDNAKVVQTYWYENPYKTETTIKDALDCKKKDPQAYRHIWLGEPSSQGSKVYSNFVEEVHVGKCPYEFKQMCSVGNAYVGMDPHKTAYPATLFGMKIPTNAGRTEFDYVIYNEFPTKSDLGGKFYHEVRHSEKCKYTQKQLTSIFYTLERTVGATQVRDVEIRGRACDPYFAKGAGGSDWSSNTQGLVAEWSRPENGGLYWTLPDPKKLVVQRNTINEHLLFNEDLPISAINAPRLYIMPHCLNLITSMKYHRDSTEKDVEDEKYKDFSDALRILFSIMTNNGFVDVAKKNAPPENIVGPMSMCKNLFFRNSMR